MERRHDEILTARLEDVLLNGCSHITWDELITGTVYRRLRLVLGAT